ncbi:MAG TPA: methyl-accepting chemotaxis protein [Gemmatimonadaceae bacterium]|nr:methyl-accepting chemotaxis protein [Gemmatimonadaceae bacterium]
MSAVRDRLVWGFGSVTLTLLACGGLGITALEVVHSDLKKSVHQATEVSGRLSLVRDATLRFVTVSQASLMAAGASREDSLRLELLDTLSMQAAAQHDALMQTASLGTEERVTLERLAELQGDLEVRFAVARAYRDIGRPADAFREGTIATRAVDTLFDEAAVIARAQDSRTSTTLSHVEGLVTGWRGGLITLLVIGLVATIVFTRMTVRAVTHPLDQLTSAARTLGDGDLRTTIAPDGLDSEYAAFARAFADTAARLRKAIAEVQQEAQEVADSASSLTAASSATAASTGEISDAVSQVASGVSAQREALAGSSAAIHDVTRSTEGLADAAARAKSMGDRVREGATRIRDGLEEAVKTFERAEAVINMSGDSVDGLRSTAETVQQFVDRVREIAEQSNLLALNAAIEAARAGDHGRGFGVVASEVRQLATQSSAAASEAARIVNGMRDQFATASKNYRTSVAELGDVGRVSQATADALQAIDGAVDGTATIAVAVASAADTSRQAVEQLITRVQSTAKQADEQGARAEGAAAAAEQTAATAQEVAATASHLADSALRLRTVASRFKV